MTPERTIPKSNRPDHAVQRARLVLATISKAEAAYFRMINEQGGINGRKINLIAYDDGYNPAR